MTDAITEARQLSNGWQQESGRRTVKVDVLEALIAYAEAAKARVTALEQSVAQWKQLYNERDAWLGDSQRAVKAAEARAIAAEEQLEVLRPGGRYAWKSKYEALQAQLTAVRALVQKWRDPAECDLIVDYAGAADELDAALPPTPEET